ncbi:MAG: hypothetical protein HYT72_00120 [Candidatus Aenigmarchaeota archaeon]|nr:hypothetical protein [Candidatus Aenigmarchaeota archaeon]
MAKDQIQKDIWDKFHIISIVILTTIIAGGTLYGAYYTGIIATQSIPNATEAIKSSLRSCNTPYPIAGHVTYNGKPVVADIEINNIDLGEIKKDKSNELGEYLEETANWHWPGGSRIKIMACYDTIACETKEFVMACSKGYEDIDFEL